MISYELARQLKEAGFSQDHKRGQDQTFTFGPSNIDGDVTIPSLEELIEACGEQFRDLHYWSTQTPPTWQATPATPFDAVYGSTPTEAVAKLWLALNKKPPLRG